jgi:AraC-like DNA-binding protein
MNVSRGPHDASHCCWLVLAMTASGYSDRIYPATELAPFMGLLGEAGVPPFDVLHVVGLNEADVESSHTLISVDQILTFYREIIERIADPTFAYRAGLRFHLTTYGMYGLAIMSSKTLRHAFDLAVKYRHLSSRTISFSFDPQGQLARWTFMPVPHPWMRGQLYRFVVELTVGVFVALHRDLIGPDFRFESVGLTFDPDIDAVRRLEPFEGATFERSAENWLCFDSAYLDREMRMGSPAVNRMLVEICEVQLAQLRKRVGVPGQVREEIEKNACRTTSIGTVARRLNLTERSLRRRLEAESTSYREIHDELQLQAAIRYLRDTAMTIEDIAESLGYSDAANFRRAFRRWTNRTPQEYRTTPA